ncbi:MAG: hypothetical protein H6Q73_1569 [Firmicutes bacterium]|nr:hypothetical protein [Bacillota bacterium]
MKKTIFLSLIGLIFTANVGFAAPAVNLDEEQAAIGFTYSQPSASISGSSWTTSDPDYSASGFIVDRLDRNLSIVGERQEDHWSNLSLNTNDVYGKFDVTKNIKVMAGYRWWSQDYDGYSSDDSSDGKFLYGVAFESRLGRNLTGYVNLKKADSDTNIDVGVTYDMNENLALNLSHRTYKVDLGSSMGEYKLKGLSMGLICKL